MKTLEQVAEETQWLDEAKEYATSINENHLDFTDEETWLEYKNNYGFTPKEAIEDYLS